ncbi:arginine--tRNA ligase, cytoplasmic-like isoform X1 [Zingiber officinale]|uniref:arginine--tRNA ligase, cytoplasmic-like isoform X1 n=1 Tax=Zingiber officinale TaxID=94328 RepID=UPI001C4DB6DE|nr:arginine--tRNA ligase, cytoplasmic-like isoform X1 [Zingiber officinale]XP_042424034.1 arginine--tRNA ligase, cytoplasmic-like isoform X1 [Zingiber officinale]XP_042424035.1 arginine--tRNA ligase, cytoplasmic-like isoform X1 [Zingiber officinale]
MFTHPCRHRRRRRPPSLVSTTIPPQHCLLCDSLGLRKEVVSGGFGLRNLKLSRYFNLNPTSMKVTLIDSPTIQESLESLFPDEVQPIVAACQAKFGDYQCDNAMVIWSQLKGKTTQFKNPSSIGQAIAKNLPESEMIESTSVAGPGFVNIKFSNKWYTVWHVNRVFV